MDQQDLKKIDPYVVGCGIIAVVASAFFLDLAVFLGAVCGVAFSVGNWRAFRFIGQRLATDQRARFGVLLGLKFLVVLGATAVVLWSLPVSPVAFFVGVSSLFVGITAFATRMMFSISEATVREEQ